MPSLRSLIAILALLALSACQPPAPSTETPAPAAAPIELRTYAVPPALGPEVRSVVDRLLAWGKEAPRLGRAVLAPGGKLVVSAPPSVHAGIDDLIAGLGESPPAPRVVELTYWLVEGRATEGAGMPPELKPAKAALDAIVVADGPRTFSLIETVRLRTLGGEHGEVKGRAVKIKQSASVRGDQVLARVEFLHPAGEVRTHVALPIDTLLVLGQSGGTQDAIVGEAIPATDLYYLVRARVAAAH